MASPSTVRQNNSTNISTHGAPAGQVLMSIRSRPMYCSSTTRLKVQTAMFSPRITTPPLSVVAASLAVEHLSPSISNKDPEEESRFTCQHPRHVNMRDSLTRLQTFIEHSRNWYSNELSATPIEMSEAGFFYLGQKDKVKCWYCNGLLEKWNIGHIPWQEHAKWFPMCEFLLQQKGIDFVRDIASSYPHLRRPTLSNPANSVSPTFMQTAPTYKNRDVPPSTQLFLQVQASVASKTEEIQRRKIENDMRTSEVVEQAKMMGFEEESIKQSLKKQYQETNMSFESLEALVDALQAAERLESSPDNRTSSFEICSL